MQQNMNLIYTVIGKPDRIFVDYTPYSGNFALTVNQILAVCKPSQKYMKYSANSYIFYVLYADVIYLVMCDVKYSERIAFAYLEKIRKLFLSAYGEQQIQSAKMYDYLDFAPILKDNMHLYNNPAEVDNIAKLWKQTEEVSQIINEDLQKVINRGERISSLVQKTQSMAALSLDFRSTTKTVKTQMTWRNWKMKILIVLGVILLVYIIMVIVCGGFTLSGCF